MLRSRCGGRNWGTRDYIGLERARRDLMTVGDFLAEEALRAGPRVYLLFESLNQRLQSTWRLC
jgi:hypothetical protein